LLLFYCLLPLLLLFSAVAYCLLPVASVSSASSVVKAVAVGFGFQFWHLWQFWQSPPSHRLFNPVKPVARLFPAEGPADRGCTAARPDMAGNLFPVP